MKRSKTSSRKALSRDRRLFARSSNRVRRRAATFKLESLEERTLLSVNPGGSAASPFVKTQLQVTGTSPAVVSPSDLTIDGNVATGVSVLDSHDLVFSFPTTADGVHNVSISGLTDIHGVTLTPDKFSFKTDTVPPYIVSSSLVNGSVFSPAPQNVTEVVTFSEPMNTSLTPSIDLYGEIRNIHPAAASDTWDSTGTVLTIQYNNLPSDAYQFNLYTSGFQDLAGNTLVSGLTTNFTVTGGTSDLTGLTPVLPLGSLVYQTTVDNALLSQNDTDTYDLAIDPQQTLAVVVTPVTSSLTATVDLYSPSGKLIGAATSPSPGAPAVLSGVQSSKGGTYQFTVSGGPGEYTIQPILNAYVDRAAYGGAPDNSIATATPIDPYGNNFIGQDNRTAVLGEAPSPAPNDPVYSFALNQGESATIALQSLDGKNGAFTLYDDQGDVLGSSSPDAANYTAGLNNFVAPNGGTYYVQVTGDPGLQFNLVVTRGADFTTQDHTSFGDAQDITATQQSGDSKQGGALGYLTNPTNQIGTDFYAVNANAGDNLHFATSTPAGGPNEFVNNLYPELLLYDPNGNLVAVAAGNASDGRNSVIDFTVPEGDAGKWVIEVTPSPNTETPSSGEYGLLVTGATGSLSPFVVTATTPAAGALVQPPTDIIVTFNDPVLGTSLTPGELEVNGVAATAVSMVSANTVDWSVPSSAYATGIDLPNIVTIGADSDGNQVTDVSGQTLTPYSYTFFTTNVAPYVVSSSIDGSVFSPAPANVTEVVTFSQPMDTSFTTQSSFDLLGNYRNVQYAAASYSWDPTDTILTINYTNLPDDTYTLTLFASGFENSVGIQLASNYVANFAVALGTVAFPTPLTAVPPLGDLIYTGTDNHVLVTPTDVDGLTLALNAGETLTLIGTPTGSAQQLVITVLDPDNNTIGTATASAPGQAVTLETVPVDSTGTYTIQISDAGGNIGLYSIQAYLNSYIKQGTSNDTIGTAQDLSSNSYLLGPGDADRLGVVDPNPPLQDTQDYYSFDLTQGQSTTIVAESLNGLNLQITLVDGDGNVLATGVGGSTNVDSKIENFVAQATGTYYVEITGDPGVQYSLTVTRSANFDIEPNNTPSTAQSLTGTNGVLGALDPDSSSLSPAVDNDWYSINVAAGNSLYLQSYTPSDQGGQFINTAAVNLELYDTFGKLVAVGSVLPDGRNEALFFNAPITGTYFIHVFNNPGNSGEYYLSVETSQYQSGAISGEVYNDLNGSGSLLPGDPGLNNWEIDVYDSSNNFVASQLTSGGGYFDIAGLAPGTYTVDEVLQSGWTQTQPAFPYTYTVTVTAGGTSSGNYFGNFQNITISGEKFNDLTGSGSFQAGDPGLPGWTIDLFNSAGAIVATAVTDQNGDYSFSDVGPGTYTVQEELQPAWIQTFPAPPGTYTFTATSGSDQTGLLFGNFQLVTFSGEVYNDLNGSGVNAPGDPGLQGWTVNLLDSSRNIVATTTSAFDGTYSFSDVGPGTYTIEEVNQTGWYQTEPVNPPGTYTEEAISSTNPSGLDFGNFQLVNVTGEVYNDLNGNGNLDPGEPGLQGWTVLLLNPAGNTLASTTSDVNGNYEFDNLFPGTFTVEEILQAGWIQTQPVNPNYYQFTTQSGLNETGLNFGNFQLVNVSGQVYNDLNGSGSLLPGDPGLNNWEIDVYDSNNNFVASQLTANGGYFDITGLAPGTYTVAEVLQSGWTQTAPLSYTYIVTVAAGQTSSGNDFGNFQNITISGEKFNDLTGSGTFVPGDPGLPGWTIDLLDATGAIVATTVTDQNGDYSFTDVGPGVYTVQEELQPGWIQTFPAPPGTYTVTATSGSDQTGLLFGNFQLVTFAGTVYNDLNGNGVLDQGDPGLQGWTVNLLDSSGNIVATTTSADDGTYSFSDVGPSTYTIEEVNQTGWYQTEPVNPPGTYTEQAISSTNPSGLDFGNFQLVNVTGQVYNDRNGNGSNDGGTDPGLQGWTVLLLDPSGNTVATTTSDMNGNYMFANLFPGTFTVEEILQAGWIQTQPVNPNYYQFTTQSGMNQTGLDFGNFVNSENFYGTVYNDLVGNGIFDAYDPPLAGWTINVLNSGGSVVATTTSAGDGTYSFTALPVQQYTIQEVTPPGWVITEPTNPPGTYTLPGLSGIYTGLDFGNFQLVSVSGNVYNDLNGNGNQDPGDAGLKGWMVDVINSSGQVVASALTDPNGNYTIGSIGPGSYTLAEVVQSGWVQTQPVNPTYYSFTTSSGTNIAGGIFGNFQTVTLSGEVYNDLNGDGMIDPGDTGFSGWTVNLLNSQDKVIATTTTDSNGNYSFAGVGPGAQTLQEVPQNGPGNVPYLPTVPSTGTIAITPTSGTNRSGLNFGNILQPEVVDVRIDWGSESMSILNLTRNLPFININAIDIIFNENVIVSKADLTLESLINSGNSYNFSGFSYIPATHDAKWSLPTAIGVDSLMMALEGVHVNPGIYLNEFTQKFKVLPGDVNGDGVVNSLDMGVVRNEIVGISPETVWADLDGALDNEGNIVIDMNDYNAVKKRLGSSLS